MDVMEGDVLFVVEQSATQYNRSALQIASEQVNYCVKPTHTPTHTDTRWRHMSLGACLFPLANSGCLTRAMDHETVVMVNHLHFPCQRSVAAIFTVHCS